MRQILFFFAASITTGVVVTFAIPNDQARLFIFACFVFMISLYFPRYLSSLDSSKVDLIYYGMAISAAVVIFISTEPRVRKINLENRLNISEREAAELRSKLSEKIALNLQLGKRLAEAKQNISQLGPVAKLGSNYLLNNEKVISRKIYDIMELEKVELNIQNRINSCRGIISETADNNRLVSRDALGRIRPSLVSPEAASCATYSLFWGGTIAGDPSYRSISSIMQLVLNDDKKTKENRTSNTYIYIDKQRVVLSAILREIKALSTMLILNMDRPIFSAGAGYERALKKENQVQEEIDELKVERATVDESISNIKTRIERIKGELERLEGENLKGIALTASTWLAHWWPYVLISLLGLKIARKEYVPRTNS